MLDSRVAENNKKSASFGEDLLVDTLDSF